MARNDDVEPAVFTLKQASQYLRINMPALRAMLQSGQLDCYRSQGGKEWRIPRSACDRLIREEVEYFRSHRHEFEPSDE